VGICARRAGRHYGIDQELIKKGGFGCPEKHGDNYFQKSTACFQ
jgi:hypothetical protein